MSLDASPPIGLPRALWRYLAPVCLVAALVALPRAWGHDHDQDRVRDAVRAGEVMPFDALRERLRKSHPGDVLELELERERGRWIYEVKLLQPDGRIVKLEVDARSGEVLRERPSKRRH